MRASEAGRSLHQAPPLLIQLFKFLALVFQLFMQFLQLDIIMEIVRIDELRLNVCDGFFLGGDLCLDLLQTALSGSFFTPRLLLFFIGSRCRAPSSLRLA